MVRLGALSQCLSQLARGFSGRDPTAQDLWVSFFGELVWRRILNGQNCRDRCVSDRSLLARAPFSSFFRSLALIREFKFPLPLWTIVASLSLNTFLGSLGSQTALGGELASR